MKTFREFMNERKEEHPNGTYISVKLNKESQKKLDDFVVLNRIPNPIDAKDFHCTVIYSRKGIPEAKHYDMNLPLSATTAGLKVFPTFDKKNALVVKLNSKDLDAQHKTIMDKYGATYDYPEYIPHITLSYDIGSFDWQKLKLEPMSIIFDDEEFTPLDTETKMKPRK